MSANCFTFVCYVCKLFYLCLLCLKTILPFSAMSANCFTFVCYVCKLFYLFLLGLQTVLPLSAMSANCFTFVCYVCHEIWMNEILTQLCSYIHVLWTMNIGKFHTILIFSLKINKIYFFRNPQMRTKKTLENFSLYIATDKGWEFRDDYTEFTQFFSPNSHYGCVIKYT